MVCRWLTGAPDLPLSHARADVTVASMAPKGDVVALSASGEVMIDTRGGARALRVSWHHDLGVVVLSLWREERCVGTFRMSAAEVPALVNALVEGLAAAAPPKEQAVPHRPPPCWPFPRS